MIETFHINRVTFNSPDASEHMLLSKLNGGVFISPLTPVDVIRQEAARVVLASRRLASFLLSPSGYTLRLQIKTPCIYALIKHIIDPELYFASNSSVDRIILFLEGLPLETHRLHLKKEDGLHLE